MSRIATPHGVAPSNVSKPAHDRIAMRAYEKWLERGCQHDDADRNWLEAEAELMAEMTRTGTTTRPTNSVPRPAPAPAAGRRH